MKFKREILRQQRNEITESMIYEYLANIEKNSKNKKILKKISLEERAHYKIWENITKTSLKPNKTKIYFYIFLARILGLTFTLKLMESNEWDAQKFYETVADTYPIAKKIQKEEEKHQNELIDMLKDEKLNYASSIVLGLNDALVELTGTLAGLTFAFKNSTLIGATWIIMWIAAAFSMAASWYLASKESESDDENPILSAVYTGWAYIITVVFLVLPYFIFSEVFISFLVMILMTVLIIALYTFYISVAKSQKFICRFTEMIVISLGVAIISFIIGILVKNWLSIDI